MEGKDFYVKANAMQQPQAMYPAYQRGGYDLRDLPGPLLPPKGLCDAHNMGTWLKNAMDQWHQ